MNLPREEYERLRTYVHEACGIALGDAKEYLVQSRLKPLVRAEGCDSWQDFCHLLKTGDRPHLREEIIAAITTNETSFFRDRHPFEAFRKHILPQLGERIAERKNRPYRRKGAKVRLWCAASSTGQEPYSMCMLIDEYVSQARQEGLTDVEYEDFSLLATDISARALSQAISGEYSELEIARGLPEEYRRHFRRSAEGWYLDDALRSIVEFRKFNLTGHLTPLGGFDLIACRNVLIYFDTETKQNILRQFHQMLAPDGYLLLGHSENLYGLHTLFQPDKIGRAIVYRKL